MTDSFTFDGFSFDQPAFEVPPGPGVGSDGGGSAGASSSEAGSDGPRPKRRRRRRRKPGNDAPTQAREHTDAPDEHDDEPDPVDADKPMLGVPVDELTPEIFAVDRTFESLGLRGSVVKGCTKNGFRVPTHIQAQLIPAVLSGVDVIGQAKTGTGKTAAFGLPLLHLCEKEPAFQALVLAPTRELALQIAAEIDDLGSATPIRAAAIYGGARMGAQIDSLKRGPQIVVGTPGRIMDMIERGHLTLGELRYAVLDEVDRMLDIGFREDIRRILGMCPSAKPTASGKRRQTIFVSATISDEIDRLARSFMHEPTRINVNSGSLTVHVVTQRHLLVEPWDKRRLLLHLLTHEEPALTLVFCKLKKKVDDLVRYLKEHKIEAEALHGDMSQSKREATMRKLRKGSLGVLVASDLVSRGIDVEGITHVVNYDLPDDVELYVHRIGRTARAGRDGVAWSLVTPEQGELLTDIEKLINAEIPKLEYPDFKPGTPPPEIVRERERQSARKDQQSAQRRTAAPAQPPPKAEIDKQKFPGGLVPTKLPPKLMGGKLRGRR